jgi:hypothetical protein
MKYGKPTKNKKRIDPRYFLNEKEDKDKELPGPAVAPPPPKSAGRKDPSLPGPAVADPPPKSAGRKDPSLPGPAVRDNINEEELEEDDINEEFDLTKIKQEFLPQGMDVGSTKFGTGVKQRIGDNFEVAAGFGKAKAPAGAKGGGIQGGVTGTFRWEEGLNRDSEPPSGILKEDKGGAISNKISKLRDEGKPQDQAVAIAHSMEERGELDEASIEDKINEEVQNILKAWLPSSGGEYGPQEPTADTPEFREKYPDWAHMTPSGEFEEPLPNVVDAQFKALVDTRYKDLLDMNPAFRFGGDQEQRERVLRDAAVAQVRDERDASRSKKLNI